MRADRIIRVFCVDGPCRGLQFLDLDTGRILLDHRPESASYIYWVDDHGTALTDFGPSRATYFELVRLLLVAVVSSEAGGDDINGVQMSGASPVRPVWGLGRPTATR
jgi:hypothetical protein